MGYAVWESRYLDHLFTLIRRWAQTSLHKMGIGYSQPGKLGTNAGWAPPDQPFTLQTMDPEKKEDDGD